MQSLKIDTVIKKALPQLQLACISCNVKMVEKDNDLWQEIGEKIEEINTSIKEKDICQLPAIKQARKGYKACGKDPARYRLSAEALLRRVLKQQSIYQINNVVDIINLISISTGFSIGGYDAQKIEGTINFGIGKENEPYQAIGRGELNIAYLPIFRDNIGAFGSPTSDSQRTSINLDTKKLLMIIIDFGNLETHLQQSIDLSIDLLKKYAFADNITCNIIN